MGILEEHVCGDGSDQHLEARFHVETTTRRQPISTFIYVHPLTMSSALLKDPEIEETLRTIVARLYKSGDHAELTVKRVRKAAEVELELPDDYLKESKVWKSKSKEIIADEHVRRRNPWRMLASDMRSHRENRKTKSKPPVLQNLSRP